MIVNKLSIWATISLCLYLVNLQAQTKIWGAGALNGVAHGEFQNSFITTGLSGSYAPNSWTALSIYDNNTTTPGNAYWTQSLLGYSQGPSSSFSPIPSPSQANGIALFDSDFLSSSMSSLTAHKGALISPKIDLTNYEDSTLVVQFFSEYKGLLLNELSISMSIDSGTTWSPPIDYRIYQDSVAPSWVRVHFPNITNGANNLSNCRLRFIFEGAHYYASIDDVSIETAPDYDIAIAIPEPASNILAERGDVVKIGGNQYQSILNLSTSDIHQWNFGLRAINYGTKKLLPIDSSRIRLSIDHIDRLINMVTPNIYTDTLYLGDTLLTHGQNSSIGIDQLRDINFTLMYGSGLYRVKYWVEHKHTDAYAGNDTLYHSFIINNTGSHGGYISKAALNNTDQKVRATNAIFPPDSILTAFEYGSMFYFPQAGINNLFIESVDFRYFVPPNYTGSDTAKLLVSIYEFTDGSGSTPADGYIDPNGQELLSIGAGVMTLSGLGTTTSPGTYGIGRASNFVDPAFGGPMLPLNDNKYYFVTIMHSPHLLGSPNNSIIDSTNSIWFGVDNQNYAMNMSLSNSNRVIAHSFISKVVDTTSLASPQFNWEEYRLNMVPSIGINVTISSNTHSFSNKSPMSLSISPNPSSDIIRLKMDLSEPSKVEYILTNVSGQIISISKDSSPHQKTHNLDIKHLPSGTYFVTARTKEGQYTQSFIKN